MVVRESTRLSALEEGGGDYCDQQSRWMQEDVGTVATLLPRVWISGCRPTRSRTSVAMSLPCRYPLVGGACQNVQASDPRDVNDHLAVIRPAEREPGIALVRNTPLRIDLQAGLNQG